jgi:hypothetical protein
LASDCHRLDSDTVNSRTQPGIGRFDLMSTLAVEGEWPHTQPMPDRLSGLVVVLALPLVMAGFTACGRDSDSTEASADSGPGPLPGGNGIPVVAPGTPCPMAVHGDPMKVALASRAPVYLPSDGAAQVTAAWRCGSTPVFMFDDVQLSFESGWDNVKIPEKFEDLARDYGGSVETIQGLPAWVAPSSASASNDEVLIVKDGSAIKLLAQGDVPVEDLIEVANRLDLGAPVSG